MSTYLTFFMVAHAIKSDGKVYVSGSIGCDKEWKLIPGGVQEQTVIHILHFPTRIKITYSWSARSSGQYAKDPRIFGIRFESRCESQRVFDEHEARLWTDE